MNEVSIKKLEVETGNVGPVSATGQPTFSISLYEYQGKAHVHWSETMQVHMPLVVAIFSGTPPTDPNKNWLDARDVSGSPSGVWGTNQLWGSGYSAALLGQAPDGKRWKYIGITTPVTAAGTDGAGLS